MNNITVNEHDQPLAACKISLRIRVAKIAAENGSPVIFDHVPLGPPGALRFQIQQADIVCRDSEWVCARLEAQF